MTVQDDETFRPTNGRIVGVLGLLVVLALLALGAVDGLPLWGVGLLAVIGVLTWAAVLRPGVRISGDELVLRNMLVTEAVPLGAIQEVAVHRVLAVRAGDRRFVSPAIGRSRRQTLRSTKSDRSVPNDPDFVEERIRTAAANHRERLGISEPSDEQEALARQVRRDPAWPELVALAVAVVTFVVGVVLAL